MMFETSRVTLTFFDCLDKGRRNWNALRPRGPILFCASAQNIPSRATQIAAAGAASASRQRPAAHKDAGYESEQKPCFFVHFVLFLDFIDKLTKSLISCVFREVIVPQF